VVPSYNGQGRFVGASRNLGRVARVRVVSKSQADLLVSWEKHDRTVGHCESPESIEHSYCQIARHEFLVPLPTDPPTEQLAEMDRIDAKCATIPGDLRPKRYHLWPKHRQCLMKQVRDEARYG